MEILKNRWIKIPGIDLIRFEGLKRDLIRKEGIHDLSLDDGKQRVKIAYDLEKITFEVKRSEEIWHTILYAAWKSTKKRPQV